MKRLLTLSALLLFSVDVHSLIDSGEVCFVRDRKMDVLEEEIKEKCKDFDVIHAILESPVGPFRVNELSVRYCHFGANIVINTDVGFRWHLQCIKAPKAPREVKD